MKEKYVVFKVNQTGKYWFCNYSEWEEYRSFSTIVKITTSIEEAKRLSEQ